MYLLYVSAAGLCIFCSFVFLTGGIVLITLSFLTLDKLQPVKLAVVASGIVFVLLSLLWPCGWLWNQWNKTCGCSYAPFVAYTWTLSLVYTAVVGALVFGVNEHYDCIHYCKNCTFEKSERYPCEFVQMSLWTMMTMMALMVVVVFVSFCYCCCGSSCKKDSGQGYTTL
ncbi:hypothetical protein GBAR_LOCUS28311 [Geodia barretti]|uniref:Uncharacterized protein n=1 Tax=Geodia barretti TaxID=519541 RepID=A0AA35TQ81_GEOBA|nr:hypothetical protein GBAR_LOCUS28311 [Geodia barretti]